MDNYEINILRRNGNWKKVKPNDLIMNIMENDDEITEEAPNKKVINSKDNILQYLSEVNTIISKLEVIENEKSKLKDQLKNYEQEFINKKKITDDKINMMAQEKEMLEKTISVIKNLKSF
jgi:hypothetical protein